MLMQLPLLLRVLASLKNEIAGLCKGMQKFCCQERSSNAGFKNHISSRKQLWPSSSGRQWGPFPLLEGPTTLGPRVKVRKDTASTQTLLGFCDFRSPPLAFLRAVPLPDRWRSFLVTPSFRKVARADGRGNAPHLCKSVNGFAKVWII
jgi:hypothetical protein